MEYYFNGLQLPFHSLGSHITPFPYFCVAVDMFMLKPKVASERKRSMWATALAPTDTYNN